ncbi:sensor histidine kinase [Microvirga arabica]|uniref:sensor histidine kinase n=1 Tax=Microvirga arabica TaxID=1128671 RepID=UPI00193A2A4A|nr:histidine kinase [Microvirga arabica]MBM1174477.1 hypothetical protein [Microvirga arabica]
MESSPRHFVLSERIFVLPPERVVAFARLVLTLFALIASILDPPESSFGARVIFIILAAYLCFAAVSVCLVLVRPSKYWEQIAAHTIDIACVCLLMHFNQGPNSPFFIFFTFILLSATLRWGWRGAIGTSVLLVLIFLVLILLIGGRSLSTEVDELSRSIVRPAYLVVAGLMLGYVGALQERSRTRLAKLAAWPGPDYSQGIPVPIGSALAHAGIILGAQRVLVIWEPVDEPFREVAVWSRAGLQYSRESPDRFGSLVAPALADRSFSVRIQESAPELLPETVEPLGALIDPDLRETFSVRCAVTAPFSLPACKGRVFLLEAEATDKDDMVLAELVTTRIGIDLEHYCLRNELEEVAKSKERARLARDLHDGVLQGLAAANIQLRLSSDRVEAGVADQLHETRQLLAAEQRRIRAFVEQSRSPASSSLEMVVLAPEIDKVLKCHRQQWKCEASMTVEPSRLQVTAETASNVRHFLAEAISNAVRHGKASSLQVEIKVVCNLLCLTVSDNGLGFHDLHGTYSGEELLAQNLGPRSLRTRAEDMGGTFTLHTSRSGTRIHVEVLL